MSILLSIAPPIVFALITGGISFFIARFIIIQLGWKCIYIRAIACFTVGWVSILCIVAVLNAFEGTKPFLLQSIIVLSVCMSLLLSFYLRRSITRERMRSE